LAYPYPCKIVYLVAESFRAQKGTD